MQANAVGYGGVFGGQYLEDPMHHKTKAVYHVLVVVRMLAAHVDHNPFQGHLVLQARAVQLGERLA